MNTTPIDKTTAAHYTWGNHCDSWVLLDRENLSIKQESMPPGTRELLHFHHNAAQYFFIIKGMADFYLDDKKCQLSEQQGIFVSPGAKHYIENNSPEILEFLVITQPSGNNDRQNIE
jgi:mannose-6-phosphate isomerase-like protein (cupin superfamily)